MKLVIVESPTKAKTISKFLGKNYTVLASFGHLRDLPQSAKDIPEKYQKETWAKIGINVEKNFQPLYVISKGKSKVITQLKKALTNADELFLATDEDREGESISWHILEVLKPKIPIKRLVFHEITKKAIEESLRQTRDLDFSLVRAQEARRVLDRLVGYTVSPLLWQKVTYGLSAGRVQSSGLKMIVSKEQERLKFVSSQYISMKIFFKEQLQAELREYKGFKLAQAKDFNPENGLLKKENNIKVFTQEEVAPLIQAIQNTSIKITKKEESLFESQPKAPFITSSLQQDAFRKLGFGAKETMRLAQRLYEEGHITYMRTDSPALSKEAIPFIQKKIEQEYGKEYFYQRNFQAKNSAQEAHECIRPSGNFLEPEQTKSLGIREYQLYDLIWKRTLASQMINAQKKTLKYEFQIQEALFVSQGTKILNPGFLLCYSDQEDLIQEFEQDQTLFCEKVQTFDHSTRPPSRYNEASLIQRLEKEGIGRPSTYATIISTLLDRGYVKKQAEQLVPSFTALAVIDLLDKHFPNLVNYDFTSQMEDSLDKISEGKEDYLTFLQNFYLGDNGLKNIVDKKTKEISALEFKKVYLNLPENLELRLGKYGPFLHDNAINQDYSLPEELTPSDCRPETLASWIEKIKKGKEPLGYKEELPIFLLQGPYGPYLQYNSKNISVPKMLHNQSIDLSLALELLELPKTLGMYEGFPIVLQVGPFGPYVKWQQESRSISSKEFLKTTLEQGIELIQKPKGTRRGSVLIKDFELHQRKKLALYQGPYGIYIKWGTKNITIPEELRTQDISLEEIKKLLKE